MKLSQAVIDELMVKPGHRASLSSRSTVSTSTDWIGPTIATGAKEIEERDLATFTAELSRAQELLYASNSHAILVIIQALDAAGKDGTIKHVMCSVVSFKQPTEQERSHDFLWKSARSLPEHGHIGIFNRSYYEEVLVVRVHPELLASEHLGSAEAEKHNLWKTRYEDINAFEQHLHRSGTRIVKLFLHVSKQEQKNRLLERLNDPAKHWKFSSSDTAERERWDDYQAAYEDALTATSSSWAPWYVIPADHKPGTRALVGGILTDAIDHLDLHIPEPSADRLEEIRAARLHLEAEGSDPLKHNRSSSLGL